MTRRRPLVILALAWALGVAFGPEISLPQDPVIVVSIIAVTWSVTLAFYLFQNSNWKILMVISIVTLGMFWSGQKSEGVPYEALDLEQVESVKGRVANYPQSTADSTRFVVEVQGSNIRIQYFYYHPQGRIHDIRYGDLLKITVPIEVPVNWGEFDYKAYLKAQGIVAIGSIWTARNIELRGRDQGHPLLQWGYEARLKIFQAIDEYIETPASGLLKSLLLGDRTELDQDVERAFKESGVMHVLAVSGLHLGILVGLFFAMFRFLRLSFSATYVLLIPLIILYLTLVGFKISLVRASFMFAFMALGWVFAERGWILRRWIDPLQGLSLAALLILIWTPQAIHDVSFQLSFLATAGILVALEFILPILSEWRFCRERKWMTSQSLLARWASNAIHSLSIFLTISLAAQIAVTPILGWHFDQVHITTLFANLLVVPLATIGIWLSIPFLLAVLTFEPVSLLFGSSLNNILILLIETTSWLSKLPGSVLELERGGYFTLVVVIPLAVNVYFLNWISFQAHQSGILRKPLYFYQRG